jgi:hypothetical protein
MARMLNSQWSLLSALLLAAAHTRGVTNGTVAAATAIGHTPTGVRVTGRVVDPHGTPLGGAFVTLNVVTNICSDSGEHPRCVITDKQGSYAFDGVATGTWNCVRVSATLAGHRYLHGVENLGGGQLSGPTNASDIVLLPLPATVSGRVLAEDGKPCAGAIVFAAGRVWNLPAVSDADGWFLLPNQPEGALHLVALHGRRSVGETRCGTADAQVAIRLHLPPDTARSPHPSDAEKRLAVALLREAWEYSRGHGFYARLCLPGDVSFLDKPLAENMLNELGGEDRKFAQESLQVAAIRTVSATNGCPPKRRVEWPGGLLAEVSCLITNMAGVGASTGGRAQEAFATATDNPNRARLLLETELSQPGCDVQGVVLAMCTVAMDRALEISRTMKRPVYARESEWYCDTLRKMAQWLTASGEIRATLRFDRWSASDTWTPGEPTGW